MYTRSHHNFRININNYIHYIVQNQTIYYTKYMVLKLTLSALRGTDSSFQPAPSITIALFIVTTLPCQVGLKSSIESWGQK